MIRNINRTGRLANSFSRLSFRLAPLGRHFHTSKTPDAPVLSVQEALRKYMRWYPSDTITQANIENYIELRRSNGPVDLLVGILYESDDVRSSSKVVEALLADPLAAGNSVWLDQIEQRDKSHSNLFIYKDAPVTLALPDAYQRKVARFEVPSPILSGDYRPTFEEQFGPSPQNNLCLLEISDCVNASKLAHVCHFFIYVTKQISSTADTLAKETRDKILLTLVDNSEYSPASVESSPVCFDMDFHVLHHAIKIDSVLAHDGIRQFLERDTEAASEYFDSLKKSNIIEVSKFLQWFLRSDVLCQWQLHVIRSEIARDNILRETLESTREKLKATTIAECSSRMHADLQQKLIPETTEFFRKKLPWWKLYVKNDNVEYALKDFFGTHYMNKSIENYNYIKGQIVAGLRGQNKNTSESFSAVNPLQELKSDLINKKISQEVQPVVYSSISSAFVYYQLPLSVLSLVGFFSFGIQLETAIAITALGWVIGFNHVSKEWHAFTEKWLRGLFEETRVAISRDCIDRGLMQELNRGFENASELAHVRSQVLQALEKRK
ncbi:hypothetical protein E0198_000784 [Clavispora lusitaniae]|nr:hypothetical protein E0198_000784 [Clavispora lusitaniae]